ncbi:hypothetical protein DFH29DRAFT_544283 [Suillus ampliporus]|nr:hypothetical protein DFH29DRAFT_544283 [Suillus ampliporus]
MVLMLPKQWGLRGRWFSVCVSALWNTLLISTNTPFLHSGCAGNPRRVPFAPSYSSNLLTFQVTAMGIIWVVGTSIHSEVLQPTSASVITVCDVFSCTSKRRSFVYLYATSVAPLFCRSVHFHDVSMWQTHVVNQKLRLCIS